MEEDLKALVPAGLATLATASASPSWAHGDQPVPEMPEKLRQRWA